MTYMELVAKLCCLLQAGVRLSHCGDHYHADGGGICLENTDNIDDLIAATHEAILARGAPTHTMSGAPTQ